MLSGLKATSQKLPVSPFKVFCNTGILPVSRFQSLITPSALLEASSCPSGLIDCLSNLQQLEILTNWIQNPQQECDYEELDSIAETLGFSYEKIDEEFILVVPSPEVLIKIINSMKDGKFYHSVISLAGLSLPTKEFSEPPSFSNAAYDFLEELAEYFTFIPGNYTTI